jgi:hypothetical protein
MPVEDRFWPKVDFSGICWEWVASIGTSGYGQFKLNGNMVGAHRVAYQILVGEIPDGLHLDHLCRNRRCVNPDHLDPVTPPENARRAGMVKGMSAVAGRMHAAKTHCPSGHEYSDTNTRVNRRGRRVCRTCSLFATRRHRERKALNAT